MKNGDSVLAVSGEEKKMFIFKNRQNLDLS